MAEADITEFLLKLIIIAAFAVVIIAGIFLIIEFKATVKTSGMQRLGIDFGEIVISSDCTADIKGLLNEIKLNTEKASYDADKNGLSGFSCIKSVFKARTLIKAKTPDGEKKWVFGFDESKRYQNMLEFPAALKYSDGSVVPAVVSVAAEASAECDSGNSGNNCYNCLEKESCESAGCKYSATGLCEPK
ncbi:MAG: hypothetical protein WA139_04060 [Candidatus Aenigmatarchaeota archaeon]